MDPQEILDLQRRQPFEPFVIQLHDGRRFEVRHPELMVVGKRSVFLGWHENGESGPIDKWPMIDPVAIATLHPLSPT